jgi:hypothetical protein
MWEDFSRVVLDHVEHYTVKQYGDYPNDNITKWSTEDCLKQIQKYSNRFFTNARGQQELRQDLLKIAHYCQLTYYKIDNLEVDYLV